MTGKVILKLSKVFKYFGGVKAVNNCSFDVKEGIITGLIGPNGAGKTTAFNLITGQLDIDSGSIKFMGKEISKKRPHKIARLGISRTFQQVRLFDNLTIEENLLLGVYHKGEKFWCSFFYSRIHHELDKKVDDTLKMVGLTKSKDTLAAELSYGQKRLVEIARALMMDYSLLLLDEPTAGVNPAIRKELMVILRKLRKQGKTILLIEHDMDFVMGISDEVIVLEAGHKLVVDRPSVVRKDKRVLEAYLGK